MYTAGKSARGNWRSTSSTTTSGDDNETLAGYYRGLTRMRICGFRLLADVEPGRCRMDRACRRYHRPGKLQSHRRRQLEGAGRRHRGRQGQGRLSRLEEFLQGLSDQGGVLGGYDHE